MTRIYLFILFVFGLYSCKSVLFISDVSNNKISSDKLSVQDEMDFLVMANKYNVVDDYKKPDISHRYQYKVRGKSYKVFNSKNNFSQIGIASWYGPGFHGKKTANGEIYNMYAMTAAHKTLPLGTKVEVTNLVNGRKVKVRINDRGPFHKGRVIDLSKKAADKIGMLKSGYTRVYIKVVE